MFHQETAVLFNKVLFKKTISAQIFCIHHNPPAPQEKKEKKKKDKGGEEAAAPMEVENGDAGAAEGEEEGKKKKKKVKEPCCMESGTSAGLRYLASCHFVIGSQVSQPACCLSRNIGSHRSSPGLQLNFFPPLLLTSSQLFFLPAGQEGEAGAVTRCRGSSRGGRGEQE
jgi:hypothetical protein